MNKEDIAHNFGGVSKFLMCQYFYGNAFSCVVSFNKVILNVVGVVL